MTYRRRASPLHAARAGAGAAFCAALGLLALTADHPLVLAAALVAVLGAAVGARVLPEIARAALWALPFAIAIAIVNPFVSHDGLTVIARLGTLPWLGRVDITLESLAYGGMLGLRAFVVLLTSALAAACVDPDELLRLFRRISFRSALTAALATRMVPVLARDGRRLADAQRCRPGPAPSRLALVRATAAGALDRAIDAAAALELRGYALPPAGGASRGRRSPAAWSRHDLAFSAAAVLLLALTVGQLAAGTGFHAYPTLAMPLGQGALWIAVATVVVALLPFTERRGIAR